MDSEEKQFGLVFPPTNQQCLPIRRVFELPGIYIWHFWSPLTFRVTFGRGTEQVSIVVLSLHLLLKVHSHLNNNAGSASMHVGLELERRPQYSKVSLLSSFLRWCHGHRQNSIEGIGALITAQGKHLILTVLIHFRSKQVHQYCTDFAALCLKQVVLCIQVKFTSFLYKG